MLNPSAVELTEYLQESELRRTIIIDDDRHLVSHRRQFSLPQADGGWRAWLFLAGCFAVEALVWGFPFSYGVFQDYYSTHEPFKTEPSGIAAIGTSAMGIMYLGSPLCFAALQKWPFLRQMCSAAGLLILIIALVASSFASAVWHLILTQGCLYELGGTLLYAPVILFVDEWFIRRKGLAYGVMWAGSGFAGVSVPFIMSWGLSRYPFQIMLRVWAVSLTVLTGPLLFFVRPRIPTSQSHQPRRIYLGFLKDRTFLFLQLGNVLQGLGYFIPTIYLPTYARSLGLDNAIVTTTVALLNSSAVFGCIFVGVLIDRFHVTTVTLISTVGATFSVFVLWGLASSVPLLLTFSIVYGFFAGSFSSTYSGAIKELRKDHDSVNPGMIIGMLAAGRGIGSIACGPLSEALLKGNPWQSQAALGYGTGYGALISFTGTTAMLGGVSFAARRLGWI